MKLDILIFAAHPDDAELSCAGTILSQISKGKKVGIIDLTRGELGTRGNAELRDKEAMAAAKILGIHVRENALFADGFFQNDEAHNLELVRFIRKYQPEIVLANAIHDRHPDHGRGSELVSRACFLSGLRKIETRDENKNQKEWRPRAVFHYIQDRYIVPDFVVDISKQWEKKVKAIKAYKSQFFDPASKEPQTYISAPDFFSF
ncbi:MAG TPA: bacillithiol biosynthesis deacetylase BshB1, partial [Cytophagaceae bacterium]|nr:bacillithiol biosynthesis deacetylase BshB1 [Cytophagaceae bacterium]